MNSADSIGHLLGLGIFIILPLVCIILNAVSIRRRSTNAFCAVSIILTLLAMILFSFSGMGAMTTHVPLKIIEILTWTGVGFMAISTILAIIGLIRHGLKRRYTRGRWRSVVALALNGFFLTIFSINVANGVNQGVAWRKLMQPTSNAGEPMTNEAWNFKIQPPPEWSQIDTVAFGQDVRAAFSRKNPEIYALVHAEDIPDSAEAPLSAAMEILKRTLGNNNSKVEFLTEVEKVENDMLARTLEMRSQEMSGNFFHVYWITREAGTLYRITVWGSDTNASKIREEARRLFDGFELIDSQRRSKSKKKPTVAFAMPLRDPNDRG